MKLALFDIDGTLADDRHRVQYALERKWPQYFNKKRLFNDGLWPQGQLALQEKVEDGWEVGYLTGRRADLRWTTMAWLAVYGFPVRDDVKLIMRPMPKGGEKSPVLSVFKLDIMKSLVASGDYEQVVLFDDDPEVIRLITEELGPEFAVHCTWHIKESALVKTAKA